MTRGLFVGLATLDVVSHVERAPGPDEKVTATWQLLAAGGPALNAAVTFAALGGDAVLVTRVGSGPAADLVRGDLAACGVRLVDAAGAGSTPPVSSITVEADGTRRVVGLDATAIETEGDVPEMPPADVVLIDGHHPDLAVAALAHGRNAGIPRVLDAGRWKPHMSELLPGCTHVLASAAFRLDGREAQTPERLERLATRIDTSADNTLVAITAGADPITWIARSSDAETRGMTISPQVEEVDTLGAGDALHGAYAWALATGVEDPLGVAAAVAARSCEVRGTRAWLDRAPEFARETMAR